MPEFVSHGVGQDIQQVDLAVIILALMHLPRGEPIADVVRVGFARDHLDAVGQGHVGVCCHVAGVGEVGFLSAADANRQPRLWVVLGSPCHPGPPEQFFCDPAHGQGNSVVVHPFRHPLNRSISIAQARVRWQC